MSDIVLFRPKYTDENIIQRGVPWGLLYVSSFLVKEGYTVSIIDEITTPNWERMILDEIKSNPILFGVSSMSGVQIKYGLIFSQFVKRNSDIPIILCTGFSEKVNDATVGRDGIRAFVMKPFTLQEISTHIRTALKKEDRSG